MDGDDLTYRIDREALLNAFRHAQAALIGVRISYRDEDFQLCIRNDGVGIGPTGYRLTPSLAIGV